MHRVWFGRSLAECIVLLVFITVGFSGCSEEKAKPAAKGTVTAAASGDCSGCEKQKRMLSSKLKASQNQIRKLKAQLKAAKRRK
jgi:hypothetical protein